jgi:hypothetical protein
MTFASKINWLTCAYGMFLTAIMVVSCASVNKPLPNPTVPINSAISTTKDVQAGMGTVATNIDNHVAIVRKATPVATISQISPQLDGINTETGNLRVLQGKLTGVQTDLTTANTQIKTLQDSDTTLTNQVKTLTDEKNSAIHNLMIWVILFSVVGVGVAAALVFEGNTWGISFGFGCLVTLGLSIFITQYAMWFAIAAAVLCLGGIGYIVYQRLTDKKVGTQLVQTNESAKMGLPDAFRYSLFGNGPIPGHVDVIQSPCTKRFVDKLRSSNRIKLAPSLRTMTMTEQLSLKA